MKILIDHGQPFFLAHGGFQKQIEQTKLALESLGLEVEWVRWWDDTQRGDVIHYFGRPSNAYIGFAHSKRMKVVIAELLTGLGSRSAWARRLQGMVIRTLRRSFFFDRMGWMVYGQADAVVANTPWEKELMCEVFGAVPERVEVVPNGVEEVFTPPPSGSQRGPWLLTTATITPRKRVVELARAAARAETPLWIVGQPYAEQDPYALAFRQILAEHPQFLRYEGGIGDRRRLASIYAEARGFVLLSTMETRSLSSEEAAACGCPLLLSDLPWAHSTFAAGASYCPITDEAATAQKLREFYTAAPDLPPPPRPATWTDVGTQLRSLYERLLSTSR